MTCMPWAKFRLCDGCARPCLIPRNWLQEATDDGKLRWRARQSGVNVSRQEKGSEMRGLNIWKRNSGAET
eukprot:2061125-Pleurochrysis_carterae.AAC.2